MGFLLINTLLLILLFVFVCLLTSWAISEVSWRFMSGRSYSEAMGRERFDADDVVDASTLAYKASSSDSLQSRIASRLARKESQRQERFRKRVGVSRHDPAYYELRTRTGRPMSKEQRKATLKAERMAKHQYLEQASLGITHYITIFLVCSLLGLVGEEIWMWHSQGLTQSRVGVVWGPFSPLYGFGGLMFAIVLWNFRDSKWYEILLASMGAGAAIEQATGMCMEFFWHAQSWTYLGLPDAITQWVCWRSIVLWAVLGVIFTKVVLPEFVWFIGEPSSKTQAVLVGVLVAFITIDLLATAYCFYRMEQRALGIPPQNAVDVYVDSHFNNDFIQDRFQNLVVGSQLAPNA